MRLLAYRYIHPLLEDQVDWSRLDEEWPQQITVDQVYQDFAGVRDRPQLQQLLADLNHQPADWLVLRHWGELGDDFQSVCDRWSQLRAQHLQVLTVAHLQRYGCDWTALHQAEAEIQLDLFTCIQTLQRHQRSQSIRAGHAQNRLKAIPPPGKAPYGYRRGKDRYALDRTAASVVKLFFDYFLMYGSLSGAVRYIARKCSKRISVSTGHRWLTNPVYRGDLVYHNGDTLTDTHLPIISRDEAAQVDRLLRRNRKLPKRSASAPHALSGLVKCQTCHARMATVKVTAPRRTQTYLYLRPIQCPNRPRCPSLTYDAVLERTIEQICQALPRAVSRASLPDIEGLQQTLYEQIEQKEGILAKLNPLVMQGVLDAETAELRAYKLKTEIAQLKAKLAQIPPVNLQALARTVSNPSFWADLSESDCRFYLRELLSSVEIVRELQTWDCQINLVLESAIDT